LPVSLVFSPLLLQNTILLLQQPQKREEEEERRRGRENETRWAGSHGRVGKYSTRDLILPALIPTQPLADHCIYSGEISLFLTKKLGKFWKFFLF
jgi:hypothetical protein